MKIYKEVIRIKSYHVNGKGVLSVANLFNFLQEAAYRHSILDGFGQPDMAKQGLVWVLSRIRVDVVKKAILGEMVEVQSWVRSINGALSERDFKIISNGEEVVRATSIWACLSTDSFKPKHIPLTITNRMSIMENEKLDLQAVRVSSINNASESSEYRVRASDIDMVNHTNNVAYVRMVVDLLGVNQGISCIDVNFLKQSYINDLLVIRTQEEENNNLFEVVNSDDEVICRLRTSW